MDESYAFNARSSSCHPEWTAQAYDGLSVDPKLTGQGERRAPHAEYGPETTTLL